MKKKHLALILLPLLMTFSCQNMITKAKLADLVGNVFGIQSMTTMMAVYGMPVEGAELALSDDKASGTISYDNFSIAVFLESMGAGEEEIGTVPLDTLSGSVAIGEDSSLGFDVTLTGAVCTSLVFNFDAESGKITDLTADGKAYEINEALEKLSAKREKEAAEAETAAEAEKPQIQTVE